MNEKEIVKIIMSEKGISQNQLAILANMKSQSNITGFLNRGNSIRVDTLNQMLSAMGCELIIRDTILEKEYKVG